MRQHKKRERILVLFYLYADTVLSFFRFAYLDTLFISISLLHATLSAGTMSFLKHFPLPSLTTFFILRLSSSCFHRFRFLLFPTSSRLYVPNLLKSNMFCIYMSLVSCPFGRFLIALLQVIMKFPPSHSMFFYDSSVILRPLYVSLCISFVVYLLGTSIRYLINRDL